MQPVYKPGQSFDRGDDPANEICKSCRKHIRNHYGGTEYRCYPKQGGDVAEGAKAKRKVVYTIIESGEKSFWREIGCAFVNRDDSLTVLLDALPVNGRLHIRDKPKDKKEDSHG
jgi:hypothetical protein